MEITEYFTIIVIIRGVGAGGGGGEKYPFLFSWGCAAHLGTKICNFCTETFKMSPPLQARMVEIYTDTFRLEGYKPIFRKKKSNSIPMDHQVAFLIIRSCWIKSTFKLASLVNMSFIPCLEAMIYIIRPVNLAMFICMAVRKYFQYRVCKICTPSYQCP